MFRLRKKHGRDRAASSDEAAPEPDRWRAALPTDELDRFMWGSAGVPPPARSDPKYQRDWAAPEGGAAAAAAEDGGSDNVLAALGVAARDLAPPPPVPAAPPPRPPDRILLEDIVWKQRSGFGKYSAGILHHDWEQRRAVLFESGLLRYFALTKNMEGITFDPQRATDPEKSPWVYDPGQRPRGEMHLRPRPDEEERDGPDPAAAASSFDKGLRRLTGLGKGDRGAGRAGGVRVRARHREGPPGPTPFEIDLTRRDNNARWRFCFQSQSVQIEWMCTLKSIAASGEEGESDDSVDGEEGLANHGFEPGDHIIRWEMLPVLYPIQIHGIVLEAGKNCVIIADFGLASYDHQRAAKELTTWSDDGQDESHAMIMAAWDQIKPKTKRLNVVVVTDPKEVRRWSKINYGDQVEKDKPGKKKGFFKSLLPWEQKSTKKTDATTVDETEDEAGEQASEEGGADAGDTEADEVNSAAEDAKEDGASFQDGAHDAPPAAAEEVLVVEGEPEWAQPGYRPRKRTGSTASATPGADEGHSVFSIDRPEDHAKNDLPKSDSAKLVLARTHFILEHEELLPPYHVFYSNSECIAVWCKTGRWSTLQAAVYLVSSSLGFGKSATMLTVSVAAAHLVLLPALAVGGLAVVGAPLLYLRKSQEKWEEATLRLTEEFWSRAEPEVFVEAIEYWASWGKAC